MEKIDNKMLPVPLKYTYPVLMVTVFSGNSKSSVYIPELGKWVCSFNLKEVLERHNINMRLWKLRWFYKADGKTLADKNLLADKIIDIYYKYKYKDAKKYIKSKLLEDINYKCDFLCTKSDVIDLVFENGLNSVYMGWYDFSLVPTFIKDRDTKFEIIVKEKNYMTGEPIENWKTNISIIKSGHDAPKVGSHKEHIAKFLKGGNSKFKIKAKERFGNLVDYSEAVYRRRDVPVKLKCNVCGTVYYQDPANHLISLIETHGCPECKKKYMSKIFSKTFEEFTTKAEKIHGNRYTYFEEDFVNLTTVTKIYDNLKHEFFYQAPYIHLEGFGNNECSVGENLVKSWLIENNIDYRSGVCIKSLIHGRNIDRVIIDFALTMNNSVIWIEYNGPQHYRRIKYFDKGDDLMFEKQLQRDENVRDYCKNNHIQLIEIPYTYKDYESVKDLLDRVILNGEDINSIIDYNSLYNN